ncbi:hypothetical protein SERLA73DRAFT_180561 [Serpula lacrymans var. lacrymans S7.3]|uniref:Uncharacterized protein n=2 Tax=Serpula lacrymans var. lacrymans TaxID=341189 RepID=F8PVA7_SERL3|nr:uncharacterized protein SERLADRAFT_466217 [Serpula lacrymans var. lacrymans S7.9]EGO00117.1 hypothetical protein SERLA73DRAFT_180561 [Serpula lacrymans var. lacrymans S7.3]EGO25679.1 hypothetical protein SERLADRAFT_466217 [Serpula lacrymans var. lacrymans S7.9]
MSNTAVSTNTGLMDQNTHILPSSGFSQDALSSNTSSYASEQAVHENSVALLRPNILGSTPLSHAYVPEEVHAEGPFREEHRGEEPRRGEREIEEDAGTLISLSGQTSRTVPPPYNPAWDIFQRHSEETNNSQTQQPAQSSLIEDKTSLCRG